MQIRVDHSGAVPVVVVDRGYGEERLTMDDLRLIAAGMAPELLDYVAERTADADFAHALIGGLGLTEGIGGVR